MREPKTYRKKPVTVEAMQWTGENADAVLKWVGEDGFQQAPAEGQPGHYVFLDPSVTAMLYVAANQRWLPVVNGEWILRDHLGFHPCHDSAFQRGYEPADTAQDTYEKAFHDDNH